MMMVTVTTLTEIIKEELLFLQHFLSLSEVLSFNSFRDRNAINIQKTHLKVGLHFFCIYSRW